MIYALLYDYVDDMLTLRAPHRPAHLDLINEYAARGEVVLAGALTEPLDGAIIVFRADSPELVEGYVARDPYVINGLVSRYAIRPWVLVAGKERLT